MKKSIVSPGFVKRTLAKLLKLDQQLGIVVDGDVASKAIAVGKYVNLINSTITGKPDGIYVATGAVSSGGTVTAADISGDAVTDGVTNDLSEQIENQGTYGSSSDIIIGTFGSNTVYRKRFDLGSINLGNGTWTTKTVSLPNLATIIDARLLIWNGSTAYNYMNLPIYLNSTTLGIYNNLGGQINGYAYLIVDYAK